MSPELLLQTQPFAEFVLDVESVNAQTSDTLAARIDEVLEQAKHGTTAATHAYAVIGAAGAGKTHLFARLRHRKASRPTMVLLRPYFGVAITPRDILAACIDQLCATQTAAITGSPGTSQLTKLISAWISPTDATSSKGKRKIVTGLSALPSKERSARLAAAVSKVITAMPAAMPTAHLVRALLGMRWLSDEERWAELAWLSGRQAQPSRVAWAEAPVEPIAPSGDKLSEGDVMFMLRLLAHLAAPVAPLTIVFDQLENLAGDDDTRVLAYGNVISELVDSVPGLTVVQLALTSEWIQYIEPRLSLPQRSRLAARVMTLATPATGQRMALLHLWHQQMFPTAGETLFPHPVSEEALHELLHEPGVTPRQLLMSLQAAVTQHRKFAATARRIDGMPQASEIAPPALPLREDVALADNQALARLWEINRSHVASDLDAKASQGLPCDDAALAEAVNCALQFVNDLATSSRQDRSHLVTEIYQQTKRLTLVYVTGLHHSSLTAAFAKATELAISGRVMLVRQEQFSLPDNRQHVKARLDEFESNPNAAWLWLQHDDIVNCLTLARLLSAARALRLRLPGTSALITPIDLIDGLRQHVNPASWPVAQQIKRELTAAAAPSATAPQPSPAATPNGHDAVNTSSEQRSAGGAPAQAPSVAHWLQQGKQIGEKLIRGAFNRWRSRG